MILSFSDKDTEELFRTESNRRFSQISRVATRKLTALDAADRIEDMAVPPGNRLESLRGKGCWLALDSDQRPMEDCLSMDRQWSF